MFSLGLTRLFSVFVSVSLPLSSTLLPFCLCLSSPVFLTLASSSMQLILCTLLSPLALVFPSLSLSPFLPSPSPCPSSSPCPPSSLPHLPLSLLPLFGAPAQRPSGLRDKAPQGPSRKCSFPSDPISWTRRTQLSSHPVPSGRMCRLPGGSG